jgi:hypothetical protein
MPRPCHEGGGYRWERGGYLSDSEVHDDSPAWSIFNCFKEWGSIRRQLDLDEEQRRDELVVSVDMLRVLQLDVLSHVINSILGTEGRQSRMTQARGRGRGGQTRRYQQQKVHTKLWLRVPCVCISNNLDRL